MTDVEPFGYELAEALAPNGVPPPTDSWVPIFLTDLPDEPPVQPTLGDIGMLYPGARHVYTGPQESAKTLAAYIAGLHVIRHNGGTVLLIDFEMGAYHARSRLRELGATDDELQHILYLEPHDHATPERAQALVRLAPMLVIIDAAAGTYDMQGLDDNKRQDVGRIYALYIEPFWQAGIATILLDHVVKNAKQRGNYAIGSERKVGACDTHLGFEVITPISRGHTGLYKIHTRKDRYGYLKRGVLAELELTSNPLTHRITWEIKPATPSDDDHPWMPTNVMQKISGILEQQEEPISRNTIFSLVGGKRDVALTGIDHLVRLDYATETPGPRNSKLIAHTRRFTVLEWETQADPPLVPTGTPLVPGTGDPTGTTGSPPYGGNGTGHAATELPLVPNDDDIPF